MPFGSVVLVPGINVERTPTLLRTSYSQSSFGRFKDGLWQKLGGWQKFYAPTVSGFPRALHAWQDLNGTDRLIVGTTTQLGVISSGALTDITPQTKTTNFSPATPNFSVVVSTPTVTIIDAGISNVTTFDSIYFNTPISIGGIILSGLYKIQSIVGATSYTITAATNATSTTSIGALPPGFITTINTASVQVEFRSHARSVGDTVVFPISTTVGGVTILGSYTVTSIVDADNFKITASSQATSSTSGYMNAQQAQLLYYITIGPNPPGSGYGLLGYGLGGYGTGIIPVDQTGDPITATDYTLDNWGEIALACPRGGAIYIWQPTGGYQNAQMISTGPVFNGGIFVSQSTQILVAWGSTVSENIGVEQDPLLVRWSDSGDYTQWAVNSNTQAGSYRIPTGSTIVGGLPFALKNLIWTDLDLWGMSYLGPPNVYGFDKIGAGSGLASAHAAGQLRGNVYWMGRSNFYVMSGNGVQVIPCPVWDSVFQDLDTTHISKCFAAPNTPFNEMWWFYPSSSGGSGECDKYVKLNITESGQPWDYGTLQRSAWIDQSVLGPPIGASNAYVYQHETTNDADGAPLTSSFTSGYFYLIEGEDYAFVDQVIPDFKYGTIAGSQTAQIQITFNVVDYLGDTPRTFGPYTVTSSTRYIMTRFRGRQMSITVTSSDVGSFWRIGQIRYRYRPDGRR